MNLNATIFFQMLVFFVLGWFTMKFVWPPLTKAIDERRQKSPTAWPPPRRESRSGSSPSARQSDRGFCQIETHARIIEAEKQAASMIEQARREAEAERARIVAQAAQDAAQEVQRAREALRDDVAALAVKGAEQILKREVDARAHAELLNQLKAQL